VRTVSEVEQERSAALEAFARARSAPVQVEAGNGAAHEARAERERREAVRLREQQALTARAEAHRGQQAPRRPRAIVVHRAAWTRDALCRSLQQAGVDVVDVHEDGAAGLGSIVAEQPDLVVVQQQLPWKDGLEVVREVRSFAPRTRVAVHLDQPQAEDEARGAGAHAVFPRSTRPVDMVPALVELSRSDAAG
jgi:CheY-like chemotaxis protein